jgi:hypothetical protein
LKMTEQINSIVGVVFDTKRNAGNDYLAPRTGVFGLSAEEHKVFKEQNVELMPREFTPEATGHQMNASPWRVMRIFGSIKRTGVYTLVKYALVDRSVQPNV